MWSEKIKDTRPFSLNELTTLPSYAFQFFFKYAERFRAVFVALTVISVLSATLRFTGLYILGQVISQINVLTFDEIAYRLFPFWIGAFLLSEALDFFIRKYGEALPMVYGEYISLRFYLTFASLRSYRLLNYSKEKLLTLTGQYTHHLRHFLSDWMWGITFRVTRLVIIATILFVQSPFVFAINAIYVSCFLVAALRISSRFSSVAKRYSEQTIETGSTLTSFLMNLNAVRRLRAQELFKKVSEELTAKNWIELEKVRNFHARRWLLQLNFFNILYASTLLYGIYQVKNGELELAFLIFIKWSFDELWHILVYVIEYYVQLIQQKQDALIVRREFAAIAESQTAEQILPLTRGDFRTLELKDVSIDFSRESATALRIVIPHFSLRRGERVGLIGESGRGKTTILGVLALLLPFQGKYLVNDVDCSAGDFPEGFVTMINNSDPLFKLSLRDNITLGKEYSPELLKRILDGCLVSEFALNLDVQVGTQHFNLSTGQEQRVRLARGLLQGGDIFLFDEVFNGIDQEKKNAIINFLSEFLAGKTVLMVTHNHAELRFVDTTYVASDLIRVE